MTSTGDLTVGASKFVVTAGSGNTAIAGTLTLTPLNSAGILTNNASGVVSSLLNSSGANGEVLTLVGGIPDWVAPTGTASKVSHITASNAAWAPSSGTLALFVECIGGGGGGAGANGLASSIGAGAGGGASSYAAVYIPTPAASYNVTIGTGGGGGTGAVTGTSGGDTSFGTACIADGGAGAYSTAAGNQTGGAGSAGMVRVTEFK